MNNYKELVSIIIPTYKRNDALERAIKSVMNQTYSNIEIIVVDDNADYPEYRRNNERLIKKYQKVLFIKNKLNLGGGLSRNEGIKIAKGKFIAFLDDDDEYLPEKIEKQVNFYNSLKNENVAMLYSYANMIKTNGKSYLFKKNINGIPLLENTKECIAATSWWFCTKEKLISVGGFEDISSRQDATLIMKFLLNKYEIYSIPEVLLNYYWHDETSGISKINTKTLSAEIQYMNLFEKNKEKINHQTYKEVIYIFYCRIIHLNLLLGNQLEALKLFFKLLKIKIMKIKHLQFILGIIFNKLYIRIAKYKNDKRKKK